MAPTDRVLRDGVYLLSNFSFCSVSQKTKCFVFSGLIKLDEARVICGWRVHPHLHHLEVQRAPTGGWCEVSYPSDLLESEKEVSLAFAYLLECY